MKPTSVLALALTAGVFGYWLGTARRAATLAPALAPASALDDAPVSETMPSPPFAARLPPGSPDALMLEGLLRQAREAPASVERNAMALLASRLRADGYAVDAARVENALVSSPPPGTPTSPAGP